VVRSHPKALSFVDRLFELFDEIDWDAARAIGQVGTVDNVLTKRNHAIIKVVLSKCAQILAENDTLDTPRAKVRKQYSSKDH
jgi:hypothetical protein